jgi:hypothetical protein
MCKYISTPQFRSIFAYIGLGLSHLQNYSGLLTIDNFYLAKSDGKNKDCIIHSITLKYCHMSGVP